jgi:hypothetical protein
MGGILTRDLLSAVDNLCSAKRMNIVWLKKYTHFYLLEDSILRIHMAKMTICIHLVLEK